MNIHTIYQQDYDLNNGDVSCGNDFINSYTLSQHNGSSYFIDMDEDVESGYVSGEHGSMNIHTVSQQNSLSSLLNYNNSDDIEINGDLKNGDVSCGIGLIKIHALSQCNVSSYFNEMDGDVENGDMSGEHCFMASHTPSEASNLSSRHYIKKKD